jgi:hypothetical protein
MAAGASGGGGTADTGNATGHPTTETTTMKMKSPMAHGGMHSMHMSHMSKGMPSADNSADSLNAKELTSIQQSPPAMATPPAMAPAKP